MWPSLMDPRHATQLEVEKQEPVSAVEKCSRGCQPASLKPYMSQLHYTQALVKLSLLKRCAVIGID